MKIKCWFKISNSCSFKIFIPNILQFILLIVLPPTPGINVNGTWYMYGGLSFNEYATFTSSLIINIVTILLLVVFSYVLFIRKEISRNEALEMFKDEPYKVELINELPESETISIYYLGEDLLFNLDYLKKLKIQGFNFINII